MVFHGGGRSQEDASTFGTGESAILVVVIIVPPRNIVWDQVPGVVRLVLGGLWEDWAGWGGDSANRRDGGATMIVGLGWVLVVWSEIKMRDGEVRGELQAIVLNLERRRGERDREGHELRMRRRREDKAAQASGEGRT